MQEDTKCLWSQREQNSPLHQYFSDMTMYKLIVAEHTGKKLHKIKLAKSHSVDGKDLTKLHPCYWQLMASGEGRSRFLQ